MSNNELVAYSAEDSMSMVAMVLYNLLILGGDPIIAQIFLSCRTSRMTIIRVRRMLSETEVERLGRVKMVLPHPQDLVASTMTPVTTLTALAQSIAAGLWRTHIHTHITNIHEAGEGDGPEVPVS